MIINFYDILPDAQIGPLVSRTLTRTNIIKVAKSIYKLHNKHPLSHIVSVLEKSLRSNKESVTILCSCIDQNVEVLK